MWTVCPTILAIASGGATSKIVARPRLSIRFWTMRTNAPGLPNPVTKGPATPGMKQLEAGQVHSGFRTSSADAEASALHSVCALRGSPSVL